MCRRSKVPLRMHRMQRHESQGDELGGARIAGTPYSVNLPI